MAIFSPMKKAGTKSYSVLFLEFVILVVGFFISLQVNEWQLDRENREIESEYLERLDSDFANSILGLNQNIERMAASIENLDRGLEILTQEVRTVEDYQALFRGLQSSAITGSFTVFLGTVEELKDTGHMRLIESTKLRQSLGRIWQKYESIGRISEIRNMLRGNTFPVIAKYVKPEVGNRLTFDERMVEEEKRALYVALSIIRANLMYDLSDSKELLALVQSSHDIVKEIVKQ